MEQKRILIIEDDPDISEVSSIILKDEGYQVSTCPTGSAVHSKLKNVNPDLILLDLNLPGLSGKKICEYIKSQIGLSQIPVLLMSANMDINEVAEACGANGVVQKPFDLDTLLYQVEFHINNPSGSRHSASA